MQYRRHGFLDMHVLFEILGLGYGGIRLDEAGDIDTYSKTNCTLSPKKTHPRKSTQRRRPRPATREWRKVELYRRGS
jgi:hypothetical protein